MTKKKLLICSTIITAIVIVLSVIRPDFFIKIFGEKDDLIKYCEYVYSIDYEFCPIGCVTQKYGIHLPGTNTYATARKCIPLEE